MNTKSFALNEISRLLNQTPQQIEADMQTLISIVERHIQNAIDTAEVAVDALDSQIMQKAFFPTFSKSLLQYGTIIIDMMMERVDPESREALIKHINAGLEKETRHIELRVVRKPQ